MDLQERFTGLYQDHYGAVLRYVVRRTNPETARDVVAETFLVAWRQLPKIADESAPVRPWLFGVARKVLANAERSR